MRSRGCVSRISIGSRAGRGSAPKPIRAAMSARSSAAEKSAQFGADQIAERHPEEIAEGVVCGGKAPLTIDEGDPDRRIGE